MSSSTCTHFESDAMLWSPPGGKQIAGWSNATGIMQSNAMSYSSSHSSKQFKSDAMPMRQNTQCNAS